MPPKSRSSVRVYVRVRPFNAKEEAEAQAEGPALLQVVGNAVRVYSRKKDGDPVVSDFTFDHCFDSSKGGAGAQQLDIYAVAGKEVLANARDGYNACLLAYGQTGSGKTHTMMGDIDGPERGVIPRLCADLFDRLAEARGGSCAVHTTKVQASYLEIYCEKAYDLLTRDQADLQVRQHPEKGPFVDGLSAHPVTSLDQVVALMHKGAKNRATCATLMNATSSRSHAIFMLSYTQTFYLGASGDQKVQARSKSSRIYLVDLAGSERTKLSGVTGQNMEEAKKINLSLSTLGRVIDLLADRQAGKPCVLPVRESLLTWLLADSLGGNSKTVMLAAISPAASSAEETLSTLRYAARTKCIVNEATVNETVDLKMLDELRGQIDNLQELLRVQQLSREGEITSLENQLQSAVGRTVELEWELGEAKHATQRAEDDKEESVRECSRLQGELSKAADSAHHLQVLYDASIRRKGELEASLSAAQTQVTELQAGRLKATQEAGRLREEVEALRRKAAEGAEEVRQRQTEGNRELAALKTALRQTTEKASELEGTLQLRTEQAARDKQQAVHEQEMALSALRQRLEQEKAEEVKNARNAIQQLRQKHESDLRELRDERQKVQEACNKLQARLQALTEETRGRDATLSQLQQQHQKELDHLKTEHSQAYTALKRSHEAVLANVQQQINERWQQQEDSQHQRQRLEIEEALRAEVASNQRATEMKLGRMAAHIRELQGQLRTVQETHTQDVQALGGTIAALQALLQRQDQACQTVEEQARASLQRLEATRALAQQEQQAALHLLPAHLEWVIHPKPHGTCSAVPPLDMAGMLAAEGRSHECQDALASPTDDAHSTGDTSGRLLSRRPSSGLVSPADRPPCRRTSYPSAPSTPLVARTVDCQS
eukprot:GGOE01021668.1.p1 GENE.GGOE01021668.1~~GGOE01021668.1.p1  ORF type:complete len:908 (+),score=287.98 GGOE01021668.1:49-2724(+)